MKILHLLCGIFFLAASFGDRLMKILHLLCGIFFLAASFPLRRACAI